MEKTNNRTLKGENLWRCLTTLLIVILSVLLLVSCSAEFAEDKLITGETGNGEVSRVELSSRKLIKNANLDVETKNFDTFQNTLDKTIDEFEGYVESRQITGDSGSSYRYGTVVARIPAQKLDEFISIVKDAGNVTRKRFHNRRYFHLYRCGKQA